MGHFRKLTCVMIIALSSTVTYYLRQSTYLLHKCDDIQSTTGKSHIAVPLAKLHPVVKKSGMEVDLSIGIICAPTDNYILNVEDTLLSIENKLRGTSITFKTYIGILSVEKENIDLVKDMFKEYLKTFNLEFVVLPKEELEKRMSQSDISAMYHKYHKSFIGKQTEINMLASLLIWRASQDSRYFLFIEPSYRAIDEFLEGLKTCFDKLHSNQNIIRMELSDLRYTNSLFNTKYLNEVANFMYTMSPFNNIEGQLSMFHYFYIGIRTENKKLLEFVQPKVSPLRKPNPAASISTNMTAYGPLVPSNPYEKGLIFWSSNGGVINSWLTIKFKQPIVIKRIIIITGLDIYFRDALTQAVLEESTDKDGDDCGNFHVISDFRSGMVDMKLHRPSTITSCLRIRAIRTEGHWIAINTMDILT